VNLGIRRLGSTGADVSELASGVLTFGRETDEAASEKILQTYLDAGGNFIDTADSYGRSEEVLGPLLKGVRDEVLIGSKVGLPTRSGANTEGASRLRIMRQIEHTLRRLRTEWVDIYYVHAWDPITPLDQTLSALNSLVRSGKARYGAKATFYDDCPDDLVDWAASRLTPQALAPVVEPLHLPRLAAADPARSYVVCLQDRSFPPRISRLQARRFGAQPLTINSSHSPFFSHPALLAELLSRGVDTPPIRLMTLVEHGDTTSPAAASAG
jgi:hypothetical protein